MGEDWTGGAAREEDIEGGMDDYRTPDEKADERLKEEYRNRERDPASEEGEPADDGADETPADGDDPERGAVEGMMENEGRPPELRVESGDDEEEEAATDEDETDDADDPFDRLASKRVKRRSRGRKRDG